MNLTTFGKLTRVVDATAAGTTDVNGTVVDMKGFDACTFIVGFGTITVAAVSGIHVQQGELANGSDMADLVGTSVSVADTADNQIVAVEVTQPRERYLRVVVDRATANAVIDFGIAIQTSAQVEPVTHDATTVVGAEHHLAPAEGTP